MLPTMNLIMQRGRSTIRTIRQGQMMASIDPAPHPPLFLHLQMLPTSIQAIGIKTESSILHSAPKHTWPDESEVEQSSKRRKQSHKVVLPRPYSVAKFKLTLQKTSRNIRNPRSRSGSPAPATANASLQQSSNDSTSHDSILPAQAHRRSRRAQQRVVREDSKETKNTTVPSPRQPRHDPSCSPRPPIAGVARLTRDMIVILGIKRGPDEEAQSFGALSLEGTTRDDNDPWSLHVNTESSREIVGRGRGDRAN